MDLGFRQKRRRAAPNTFASSAAELSPFEQSLLNLLLQIPATTDEDRRCKISLLVPKHARAAAIGWAQQRSEDSHAFLVNLARHIIAETPQELEQKISSLIPARDRRSVRKKSQREKAPAMQTSSVNPAVDAFLTLARHCHAHADELKAEAYVAHGVEAMPAAEIVAQTVGGRVYCDVVETPSFAQRSVTYDWHPTNLALLDHAFDSYLRHADGLSTIGWALGEELQRYGPPVSVIPNYRHAEELRRSDELRQRCGLGANDVLLLASSSICGGFEPVIEALRLLPEHVHLATLGTIVKEYRERIRGYPDEIGVRHRVHFFDPVPYARLTMVSSGANLSLMALDPSLTNDRLSLPNRVFDSIAAGLPIVTPDVPDISRIVNERQIGVAAAVNEAACWAQAITAALAAELEMRPRVLRAAKELVWDALRDDLHAAYGNAESVTIFGYSDLTDHQRTLRMADTLVQRGARVTVCCPRYRADVPEPTNGVRFFFAPHPHGDAASARRAAGAPDIPVELRRMLGPLGSIVRGVKTAGRRRRDGGDHGLANR